MKTKLFIFLFTMVVFGNNFLYSQIKFDVPKNVKLETKEDYAKFEQDIITAAKWLEETDLDKEQDKRLAVNAFVMQWITGSPNVSITIYGKLGDIYGKNSQLLMIYMASYSAKWLENKTTSSDLSSTMAGIRSMMNVYKKGINISKSKEMLKIMKMNDSELEAYIKQNFKE